MRFRPCIDIHNGKVKQIVGATLRDDGDYAKENFATDTGAAYFARLYKKYGLTGGHVIILNGADSTYYEASKAQALEALAEYPKGLMAGGGINADNAPEFIEKGASHVLVTSYLFTDGGINMDNLHRLVDAVGLHNIAIDLSCKFINGSYHVATNRWQTVTDVTVDKDLFDMLGEYCDEFLVHAVDAEGKSAGIDERLIGKLADAGRPVCYAGGISSYDDIKMLGTIGRGLVDFTVGSKLDIFGGTLSIEEIIKCTR